MWRFRSKGALRHGSFGGARGPGYTHGAPDDLSQMVHGG